MMLGAVRLPAQRLWSSVASSTIPHPRVTSEDRTADKRVAVPLPVAFKTHKLEGHTLPTEALVGKNEALDYLYDMTVIRRFEMAADNLYKAKLIRGFCHLYIGQEAICVGVDTALDVARDNIISAYRIHGYQYMRERSIVGVLAELTGRQAGCSKGKGGSMHMYKKDRGFYGGHGIVGGQTPLGAGLAFTQKYLKTTGVTMALYGDGAANQGQLFESYNMAKLWNLPIMFACENNQFGMGTSVERASASHSFYTRGDYIPGVMINGMDVLSVREGVKWAAEYSRTNGPLVLEFLTYRYQGHSMSDPGTTYRTREDVAKVRAQRDPINYVKHLLTEHSLATADEIKEVERQAKEIVDAAVQESKDSPLPPISEIATDVYLGDYQIRGQERGISYTIGGK